VPDTDSGSSSATRCEYSSANGSGVDGPAPHDNRAGLWSGGASLKTICLACHDAPRRPFQRAGSSDVRSTAAQSQCDVHLARLDTPLAKLLTTMPVVVLIKPTKNAPNVIEPGASSDPNQSCSTRVQDHVKTAWCVSKSISCRVHEIVECSGGTSSRPSPRTPRSAGESAVRQAMPRSESIPSKYPTNFNRPCRTAGAGL
jgi:hypothetical protein